jgi:dienelactone hydrolase
MTAADEVEAIRQLKARYCRYLDTTDADAWSTMLGVAERLWQLGRGVGGVLPRSVAAMRLTPNWNVSSAQGIRQLGEVLFDELTLTGMTLLSPTPALTRSLDSCAPAAAELSGLGVDGAHAEPEPLQVRAVRRRRVAQLTYEQLVFEHDPHLPPSLEAAQLGGPATATVRLCRHDDGPRPWLVWVHGAGQGNWSDLLVARVERWHRLGFNVALPVQPGHGARRRSRLSYPDHDPLTNIAGMMRAISEVRAVVQWLRPQAATIAVAGVSLGSPVAALVSHLEPGVDAVAVYTPIAGLNAMIGHHLWRWGSSAEPVAIALQSEVAEALMSVVDPLAAVPVAPADRRLIVAARHDRMASPESAVALHERWGGELSWHDGGHVGHILSGQVQATTERFIQKVGR